MSFTQKDYELIKEYIDKDNVEIPLDIKVEFWKYERLLKRHYRLFHIPNIINLPVYQNGERGVIVEIEKDKIFLLMDKGNTVVVDHKYFTKLFEIINPEFKSLSLIFPSSKSDNFDKAIEFIERVNFFRIVKQTTENKNYNIVPITVENISDYDHLLNFVYRFKNTCLRSDTLKISGYQCRGLFSCFSEMIDNYKDDYCFGNHLSAYPNNIPFKNPFGCIYLLDDNPFYGWYTKGAFKSNSIYEIDKNEIEKIITGYNSVCPIYNKNRALKVLNDLPSTIDMNDNKEWSIIEFVDANYNREKRIVPAYLKISFFNNENVYAPSQDFTLNGIKKTINTEKKLANYEFREPREIFFYVIRNNDCCEICTKEKNKFYIGSDLINHWNEKRILPVPTCNCKNEICRCLLFHFSPDNQFIDINGQLKLKVENEEEWEIWCKKNDIQTKEPATYLPELEQYEKKRIFDLKISLTIDGKTLGTEYFNEGNLIKNGQNYFEQIKAALKSWSFGSESYKDTYQQILSEYSQDELDKIALHKELETYILLLKKYKYCLNRNISSSGLFGFYVNDAENEKYNFVLLNNFVELNSFERLSMFDPELGVFENEVAFYSAL